MNLNQRIKAFLELKNFISEVLENKQISNINLETKVDLFKTIIETEYTFNQWFTAENIRFSLKSISDSLTKENFEIWLSKYNSDFENLKPQKVGVILAGNLPLVGFHDFLCVLITGNIFIGKQSSKDNRLLKTIADFLILIEPEFENFIKFEEERLVDFDAVIATGSNNSARYFEFYFSKYPNIIRQNRNSIAILNGLETKAEMQLLSDDLFTYFGLGCRNVSKLYVPQNYDIAHFFEGITKYENIIFHNKYANNFAYNRAIYLMELIKFFENSFAILKEDKNISSPVSVVFYEYYNNLSEIENFVNQNSEKLQCVVSNLDIPNVKTIKLGETQKPQLWDYADNVDTIEFLLKLK